MKTVVVDRKSWHYRLTQILYWGEPGDMCCYIHRVMWSMLFVAGLITIGAGVVGSAGDALAWAVAGILHGFVRVEFGLFFLVLLGSALAVWGCATVTVVTANHSPSFLRNAYSSLKDRVCYRLEIR